MKNKLVITIGDPAGCGPFITLKAVEKLKRKNLFIAGDKKILERYRMFSRLSKIITLIDVNTPRIDSVNPGYPSRLSGMAAVSYIKAALDFMKKEKIQRLVTAPLSKEAVGMSMHNFSGHTEFLSDYFGKENTGMMMIDGNFRIVLLTRHIPLSKVHSVINRKMIKDTLALVYSSLNRIFKIKKPSIVFASFNPHAGVNTFLGREEKIIKDAINHFKHGVEGPYPADTLFLKDKIRKYDCIVACYHDQAMIPFKLLSFKRGVNLTLGLPIIRTSPAHGTAFDLMRKGREPLYSSMVSAIRLAEKLSL